MNHINHIQRHIHQYDMPPCLQDMVNYYVKKKPIPDSQTDLADHR